MEKSIFAVQAKQPASALNSRIRFRPLANWTNILRRQKIYQIDNRLGDSQIVVTCRIGCCTKETTLRNNRRINEFAITKGSLQNIRMIKTFKEAYNFVLQQKVCTVFGSKNSPYPSLWNNTDLSEKIPKDGGWNPKVVAIWDWKTRIPQTYPDQIFYGKVPGGDAVLMEMEYFRQTHYPATYQSIDKLNLLCQQVYRMIRIEPDYTGVLRKRAICEISCSKSQFDTALKKLQISLNVVRSNDPQHQNDFWLAMQEIHPEIVSQSKPAEKSKPRKHR